ncbi:MAG: hypothetical protein M3022_01565 [Actinomycetota bacterium]|nr:hypothetical protein [Actinomycetota bacterium]
MAVRLTDRLALTAPCAPQNRLARAPLPRQSGVYAAGPIYLSVGEDLGQLPPRRRPGGNEAIATVLGGGAATLRVLPSPGVRMTLVFAPQGGPGHPSPVLADGRDFITVAGTLAVYDRELRLLRVGRVAASAEDVTSFAP